MAIIVGLSLPTRFGIMRMGLVALIVEPRLGNGVG
jgi:hypothetical protein